MKHTFEEIKKNCVHLQNSHEGKCKTHINTKEIGYVSARELCKKYDFFEILDGLHTSHHICFELLGIQHQQTFRQTDDAELGILNAYWLGLVPKAIQQIIFASFIQEILLQHTPDLAAYKAYGIDLKDQCESIQDLILAKVVGLHRIVGKSSKGIEQRYKKTFHLSKGTFKEQKAVKENIRGAANTATLEQRSLAQSEATREAESQSNIEIS